MKAATKHQKNTIAIIGSQWGDEGKGKLTDYFAQKSNIVVRWSGGDNAGHTIVFNDKKYKLNIMPSGIFQANTMAVIGNGCVVNLTKLCSEMKNLQAAGFDCQNLKISDRAHVIMPYHLAIDEAQEALRLEKIGTTKRGIGPCYEDKFARMGFRIGDLKHKSDFKIKLQHMITFKNKLLQHGYNSSVQFEVETVYQEIMTAFDVIADKVTDTGQYLYDAIENGQTVLFEGAQGTLLDIDAGTYPFVTSSNPSASSIATGTGIPVHAITRIIGVMKAYNTRVGEGSFPTEITDDLANTIRIKGNEFGTVSKRPRRIGWFDSVIARYSARINGFTEFAIMLLDVLSGLETIKICTHYTYQGQTLDYFPSDLKILAHCEPQYIELPGWTEDLTHVKAWADLPAAAQAYLHKIEALTGIKITIFSVGPDRLQTVMINEQ